MNKDAVATVKDLVKRGILTEAQGMDALGRKRGLFTKCTVDGQPCEACGERDATGLDYLCLSCSDDFAAHPTTFWKRVKSGVSESQSRADQKRSLECATAASRGRKLDTLLRSVGLDRRVNFLPRDEGDRPEYTVEIRGKDGPCTLILFISNGGRPQGENE